MQEQAYYATLRVLYADNLTELERIYTEEAPDHNACLAKMSQAQQVTGAQVQNTWKGVATGISGSLTNTFMGVLQGIETMGQGMTTYSRRWPTRSSGR